MAFFTFAISEQNVALAKSSLASGAGELYVSVGRRIDAKQYKKKEPDSSINILIRELAIPFLGSFVPGIYLWMGIIFSIIPPIALLIGVFSINTSGVSFDLLSYLSTITQNIRSGAWILFLVISYVLGAIVSKQDPKITDQRSFKRICKPFLDKNIEIGNHLACTSMENCEYPYPNLYDYIKRRGLNHLLRLIPWGEVPDLKSKAYINKLKLHIELGSSYAYRILVRNEAHIRMTNTVWHSSILIRYCCIFGIIVTLFSLIISMFSPTHGKPFHSILRYTLSSVAFPTFTLLISELKFHRFSQKQCGQTPIIAAKRVKF